MAVRPASAAVTVSPGYFFPHNRAFAGIVAQVVVEESERDEVTVTEHPVEQGAPIGDHAFKRQQEVTIQCGWNTWDGDLSAETGIYGKILDWQASFIPFDLITGKRVHRNMLIVGLQVATNQQTEFALMVQMTCREVILTQTRTETVATGTSSERSDPETTGTGPTADRGTVAPTKVEKETELKVIKDAGTEVTTSTVA